MKSGDSDNRQINDVAEAKSKKVYAKPALQEYGNISKLTQNNTSVGFTDNAGMLMATVSDRSTKENIVRIGQHPLGIGLYLFNYKSEYQEAYGHERQLGVMADEVEIVMPEAVSVHPDGYKMVNYAMLATRH